MTRPKRDNRIGGLLATILILYAILGTLYAIYTPAWQAPDEPAHYNYIRYLAEQGRFPILKMGDYPGEYLEEIKAARFPPDMSIEPIRYEFHQPPLYYLLAVPVYALFDGALLPIRLLSVFLGGWLLVAIYRIVCTAAPGRSYLALGATAFVAFLPMHLAMVASVNNDPLSELLLAGVALFGLRYLKADEDPQGEGANARLLLLMGIVTGLCFLTKSGVYIALPLALAAVGLRHLWLTDTPPTLRRTVQGGLLYFAPAIGLALPWWLRNLAIYGGLDFLGLARHDQVVAGQLRTADFIAAQGLGTWAHNLVVTTFHSFWGQFGWMGVLLDERLYQVAALLSALALIGLVLWLIRAWSLRAEIARGQWAAGGLLLLLAVMVVASYAWYNLGFLQHQGRYLFRALAPVGLGVALGWREVLERRLAWPLAAALLAGAVLLRLTGLLSNWPALMLAATAAALALRRFLPRALDPVLQAIPYLALIALAGASLFLFIVPQLAP